MEYFQDIITILNFIGWASALVLLVVFIYDISTLGSGISPVLWRLGKGLACRKIAVFAEGDDFNSLKSLLVDSNLFKGKNIFQITKKEIKKAEGYNLFVMHWKSAKENLADILHSKIDSTALIIYAPQDEGILNRDELVEINRHRNTILVNFRGRLLNDIIGSLITTSFEK
jgi:hypothetical protein